MFGSGYILSVGFFLFFDEPLVRSLLFSTGVFIPMGFAFLILTWLGGEVFKWTTKP